MRNSRRKKLVIVGAATVLVMAVAYTSVTSTSGQVRQTEPPLAYAAPASVPPLTVTSSPPTTPGTSVAAPSSRNTAPTIESVPAPADKDSSTISVYLRTKQVGIIPAAPALAPAPVRAIDPGNASMLVPPELRKHDWSKTSIWVNRAAYPTAPSTGTTYIYGHACVHHTCPFTAIRCTANCALSNQTKRYTVQPGDQVVIGAARGTLTYQVCALGSSPKYGPGGKPARFIQPVCGATHVDLVIVTCEYESPNQSDFNIVVAAHLVAAETR